MSTTPSTTAVASPTKSRATARETSAAIRTALRPVFAGSPFSVSMARGTGAGWCDVRWTDGPALETVELLLSQFRDNPAWSCHHIIVSREWSPETRAALLERMHTNEGGVLWLAGCDVCPPRGVGDETELLNRHLHHGTRLD